MLEMKEIDLDEMGSVPDAESPDAIQSTLNAKATMIEASGTKGELVETARAMGWVGDPERYKINLPNGSEVGGKIAIAYWIAMAESNIEYGAQESKPSEKESAEKPRAMMKLNGKGKNKAAAVAELLELLNSNDEAPELDEEQVRAIVTEQVAKAIAEADLPRPTILKIEPLNGEKVELGAVHKRLPDLIMACQTRVNVFLAGPAGSGKTTAAEQVAKAFNLPFYFNGAIDTEYKLKGFIDAQGRLTSTAFRDAYEKGGVYLFDEVDASLPPATMAFNSALANGFCDFPDGRISRHKDFICIAAGNTYGMGATFDYVGRNKQDAAFLDRFAFMTWDIDAELERAICPNAEWVRYVQRVRAKAQEKGLKLVISPRASVFGAQLLAVGLPLEEVKAMTIRKGMTPDQWESLEG